MFTKDKAFEERFDTLREQINLRYNMLHIVVTYNPKATDTTHKMPSILNPDDTNPSFYINYPKRMWKCFSTGKGGGYLELVYWTQILRESKKESIYKIANRLLVTDKELQKAVGFNTLFKYVLPDTLEPKMASRKVERKSIDEFHKTFKQTLRSLNELEDKTPLINFISDFEKGMNMKDLVKKYSNTSDLTLSKDSKTELESLITSLFGSSQ